MSIYDPCLKVVSIRAGSQRKQAAVSSLGQVHELGESDWHQVKPHEICESIEN